MKGTYRIMAKKVAIWGMGQDYENLLNPINFEICKNNIAVEAIICREKDRYCSCRDGFPVITKEEADPSLFDYFIVTSRKFFGEIKREILEMGAPESKVIDGSLLHQPLFDLGRYFKLIENPVTIFSDDCWGGVCYHGLKLPFSSPTINLYFTPEKYSHFIQKPFFYLDTELIKVREGDLKKGVYPIGQLGKDGDYIELHFFHIAEFEEAKKQWDRRKKRINKDNIFIKMALHSNISSIEREMYLQAFNSVKYNKILFYYDEAVKNMDDIFVTNRFWWEQIKQNKIAFFDYREYVRHNYMYDIDVLKLLTGEKYSRY